MCDRIACTHLPDLASMDFSRRSFMKSTGATVLTMGLGSGLFAGTAHAAGEIKSTHGTGFCNLNIFLAHAMQFSKEDGVELKFVNTPTFAEQVTFLGIGQVDVGLMPYTSFIALFDAGAPVKIIAGGGVEGCVIVSRPGLDSAEKLKGKTLGTFQLDTLEVMPYDWLKKNSVDFKDVKVRYMGITPEAVEAFKAGAIDWICTIEPYGTALLNDVKGSHMLSNGRDIYGKGYTDCVLACRASLIKENPAGLKALIKGMMKAQPIAETKPDGDARASWSAPTTRPRWRTRRSPWASSRPWSTRASQTQFILRAHRLPDRDGLHQEEARPRCHRLDAARTGHRREQGALRQAQVQVGVMVTLASACASGGKGPWAKPASRTLRRSAAPDRRSRRASARACSVWAGRCSRSACSPESGSCAGQPVSPIPSCCRRRMSFSETFPSRPSSSTPRSAGRSASDSTDGPSALDGGA